MPSFDGPTMDYVVSFNCEIDGEEYGETYMNEVDYEGNDIDELAEEVNRGDPNFPMNFVRNETGKGIAVGWFVSATDANYKVAPMVRREEF